MESLRLYDLKEQKKVSSAGVEKVINFMLKYGGYAMVESVEHCRELQKRDIDLIGFYEDERRLIGFDTIEVKTDTYKTGNLYFETVSCLEMDTPGCLMYCEADYLYYYFTQVDELYIMDMALFREWVLANRDDFTVKRTSTKLNGEKKSYNSEGILIPLGVISKNLNAFKGRIVCLSLENIA